MNNNHLKKTLQLIRRTGDKGIIIDEESDEIFVLMGVEAYEKMLPIDSPHPTLSAVAERGGVLPSTAVEGTKGRTVTAEGSGEDLLDEEKFPVPVELNFNEDWTPKQSNNVNEESLSDVPHNGEEEEKFYLEPVG